MNCLRTVGRRCCRMSTVLRWKRRPVMQWAKTLLRGFGQQWFPSGMSRCLIIIRICSTSTSQIGGLRYIALCTIACVTIVVTPASYHGAVPARRLRSNLCAGRHNLNIHAQPLAIEYAARHLQTFCMGKKRALVSSDYVFEDLPTDWDADRCGTFARPS